MNNIYNVNLPGIKNNNVKWIKNFNDIKKGPVIFFGNEFFDAIPIKQFQVQKGHYLEKFFRKSISKIRTQ